MSIKTIPPPYISKFRKSSYYRTKGMLVNAFFDDFHVSEPLGCFSLCARKSQSFPVIRKIGKVLLLHLPHLTNSYQRTTLIDIWIINKLGAAYLLLFLFLSDSCFSRSNQCWATTRKNGFQVTICDAEALGS